MDLNNTVDKLDLADMCRVFHSTVSEYLFFLSIPGAFLGMDHVSGYGTDLDKFRKIEIVLNVFSKFNGMKSIAGRKWKSTQMYRNWKAYSWTTSDPESKSRRKSGGYLERSRSGNTNIPELVGCSKGSFKWDVNKWRY